MLKATGCAKLTDELRHVNDRLRESERSKDQFMAMLAHELRNPLMPIRNSLALLQLRSTDPGVAGRAQQVLGRQVDQMTRLVNDLLDVTRARHGKLDLRRSRIDHRMLFLERDVGLHLRRPPQPVCVHGDAARLAQVIGNLLGNALKFTPPAGNVHLSLEQCGTQAVLQVRDTGIGIPADLLGGIFEPFTQAEQPIERPAGGLGLGLALVRDLVRMHAGEVEAHSDGLGRGAALCVRLPIDAHGEDGFAVPSGGAARPDTAQGSAHGIGPAQERHP